MKYCSYYLLFDLIFLILDTLFFKSFQQWYKNNRCDILQNKIRTYIVVLLLQPLIRFQIHFW